MLSKVSDSILDAWPLNLLWRLHEGNFKACYYHSSIPVHLGAANSCRPQVPRGHGLSTDFRPLLVAAPTVVWAMPLPERTQDNPITEECDR